ncbi:hypothetical protein C8R44DRAFT_746052 [Mycena epipterygia]|nr:hypothetical protein C8R44DRAFT_746052 [Mycena epipterygia]
MPTAVSVGYICQMDEEHIAYMWRSSVFAPDLRVGFNGARLRINTKEHGLRMGYNPASPRERQPRTDRGGSEDSNRRFWYENEIGIITREVENLGQGKTEDERKRTGRNIWNAGTTGDYVEDKDGEEYRAEHWLSLLAGYLVLRLLTSGRGVDFRGQQA